MQDDWSDFTKSRPLILRGVVSPEDTPRVGEQSLLEHKVHHAASLH